LAQKCLIAVSRQRCEFSVVLKKYKSCLKFMDMCRELSIILFIFVINNKQMTLICNIYEEPNYLFFNLVLYGIGSKCRSANINNRSDR